VAKTLSPRGTRRTGAPATAKEVESATRPSIVYGRRHALQPHRTTTFKFSNDPDFEAKMADVVGLYLDPPERALVLCVDEKSQIQALNRTQPILRCGRAFPPYDP